MRDFEVFISFKNLNEEGEPSQDSLLAAMVNDFLSSRGLRVFFSNKSLEKLGIAAYKQAIDDALDDSLVLIAIGTSKRNLESSWVRYEWESFYNDILSGLRPNKRVFSYISNMAPHDLPRTLRQNQAIVHSDTSLDTLLNFIRNAMPFQEQNGQPASRKLTDPIIAEMSIGERLTLGILCWDMKAVDILDESVLSLWKSLPRLACQAYSEYADQVIDELSNIGCLLEATDDRSSLARFTPDQIEAIAQYDHIVWVSRKQALGWNYSSVRDKSKKLTPYLVPWSTLPEKERELNLEVAMSMPIALSCAWLRIRKEDESKR